jgi:hypothetical protein
LRGFFEVVLVIAGIFAFSLGGWLIANGKLPSWAKGLWKWPLGDNLTPTIVRTTGWANVLAGFACPPAIVLLIVWDRSPGAWIVSMTAMFLAGAASFAAIWSVVQSHSKR